MNSYTADQLLAIKQPELLFTGEPLTAEKELKALRIIWHPDKSKDPKAKEVFEHLTELHIEAVRKMKAGIWEKPNYFQFRDNATGKLYELFYVKKHPFELGTMYIGKETVLYVVKEEFEDLFQNAQYHLQHFKFASAKMKDQMQKFLPKMKGSFRTNDSFVLVMEKTHELVLLKDVLAYHKNKIDPKHVAWILSSLYNLVCYLDWAELTHNAINTDTYFISPEFHSGILMGGWWYATPKGQPLTVVPRTTFNCVPSDALKRATSTVDLELIRGVGRELLCGDANKIHLVRGSGAPAALLEWLTGATMGSASKDYEGWQQALLDSFGPRKFIKLNLTFEEVYKPC